MRGSMVETASAVSPLRKPYGASGAADRQRWDGIGVSLWESPGRAKISVRGQGSDAGTIEALGRALGSSPPARIGETHVRDDITALNLGPDEWLVTASPGGADALVSAIRAAAGESMISAVDISNGLAALAIQGEN